ncbi:MAG: hypothetical protein JSW67_04580 [Candidatus Latescibacterota bacterium]|nr:MAG: hypothetical protein JSW67_04580 [Candidatus Latescibacterota bacterium]
MTTRCVDPKLGVKVLSYDLLEAEERDEVDEHLKVCVSCRDLVEQTFGNEGALTELEWRAFKATQRRSVHTHEWIARRLASLWVPVLVLVVGISALLLYVARRGPDPERVELLRLATFREATLDSLAAVAVPNLAPAPTSVVLRTDQDAIALVYESGDEFLRRLIPGGDAAIPELSAQETHELALPALESPASRILLVLAPLSATRVLADWDRAVFERLGGESEEDAERSGWPLGVTPTLRWLK